jgi:hypothetical protein
VALSFGTVEVIVMLLIAVAITFILAYQIFGEEEKLVT